MEIFIAGLDYCVTAKELNSLLKIKPNEGRINIATDRNTKKSRGFCFVSVKKKEKGEEILKLNGSTFRGRTLRVKINNKKRTGSYHERKKGTTPVIHLPILEEEEGSFFQSNNSSILIGKPYDNQKFFFSPLSLLNTPIIHAV